jgi:hypothetical protein
MNLYFLDLIKKDRNKTRWKITKVGIFNRVRKRKLKFQFPNEARMIWFETIPKEYVLGMSIFSSSSREWDYVLIRSNQADSGTYFKYMVEIHDGITFKKKNFILRLNISIALTIEYLCGLG